MKNLFSKIFKRKSEIIDVQKRILPDYDLLYFNSLVEVVFIVKGIDKKIYKVVGRFDYNTLFVIEVFDDKNNLLANTSAYGRMYVDKNNKYCLFLERIENTNDNYKHFGFGTLMMNLLFDLVSYYEEINKIEFIKITGTIGNGGGDDSTVSIPFYKSFNDKKYGKNKLIIFSGTDRHLEYQIKRIE